VLSPGLHTLIVDGGRPSSRSLGVPLGGAADRFHLAIGNALVGNPPDAAALEITLAGPVLEAGGELACVLCGAPFELHSDRQPLRAGTTFALTPGERLHIAGTNQGVRGYLCVRGGLRTPVILGSRSGLATIQAGQEVPCLTGRIGRRFVQMPDDPGEWDTGGLTPPRSPEPIVLRVLEGPQADWFDGSEFFCRPDQTGPTFTVTPASNRMGLRLLGRALRVPPHELVSEPVCPGTVQVVRDGQCIVLGVDGQTIGGYPRLATVIRADLDRCGQLRPGQRVCFLRVDLAEADRLARVREALLREWTTRLLLWAEQ
jgi:antagonist of KipI